LLIFSEIFTTNKNCRHFCKPLSKAKEKAGASSKKWIKEATNDDTVVVASWCITKGFASPWDQDHCHEKWWYVLHLFLQRGSAAIVTREI